MSRDYILSGGSMIGRDHRVVPKNNQDAWGIWQSDRLSVVIVADGCGSGRHSEVGAQLGVNMLGSYLFEECVDPERINWRRTQQALLSQLDMIARGFGGDYRHVVQDYLLFTLIGVVIGHDTAMFFAVGDGLMAVNDDVWQLDPSEGNQPPYVGYNLVRENVDIDEYDLQLRPHFAMPADRLRSFMIATDGAMDIARSEGKQLPGLTQSVSPISDFWQNERYFRGNPELLGRQLKLMGRDWPHVQPEPGLLSDDTTIIVGRRTTE